MVSLPTTPERIPGPGGQSPSGIQNLPVLWQEGLALHKQGRLVEAKLKYEAVLQVIPAHFDALHLIGVVAAQTGDFASSLHFADRAIAINPDVAAYYLTRGNALKELHRSDEAIASYDKAVAIQPDHADAYSNRGNVFLQLGRLYEALASYGGAIAIQPLLAEAHSNMGIALQKLGRVEEAIAHYDKAISIKPNYAEAYLNRGLAFRQLRQPENADASYRKAVAIKPDYAEAYFSQGSALSDMKRLQEAVASYDKAIAIKPEYAEAYNNRGVALQKLHCFDQALSSYAKALSIRTDYVDAYCNHGNALHRAKRMDEAFASYDKAIAIKPDCAEAYWNKSLAMLAIGDFNQGWELYEWRWRREESEQYRRTFSQPLWLGRESLEGKTILLHAEQGLGDSIQFCRFAKLVSSLGAKVVLEVPSALLGLMDGLDGGSVLVAQGSALPDFDFHCPLLSLPLAFKTQIGSIPFPTPYLTSRADKVVAWSGRLGEKKKPRIGLVWSGRPEYKNDADRTLALAELIPYLPPNCEYVSLQKEVREVDMHTLAESRVRHFGAMLEDFTDTAALCDLMDVVVSVDTSVAHLSGALGKPTWIMLPYVPDWRWMLERTESPWYASVSLYRQAQDRDWGAVLQRVSSDLRRLN